jgi:hypothetical protein
MRLTHTKNLLSPLPHPPRPGIHFSPFNIVMPEDQESVDLERGPSGSESLRMSGYLS